MKKRNILAWILSGVMVLGAASCVGNDDTLQRELTDAEIQAISASIPDYSSSTKQYDFFGYSAASTGYWTDDGVEYYCGQDLRNVEQFTMYKDAGMTFMHPQSACAIEANVPFTFSGSDLERVMNTAVEAGIGKVIVPDYRMNWLISYISSGITAQETGTFATYEDRYEVFTDDGELDETALDERLQEYMGEYTQHPAYYGNVLRDEPQPKEFVGYGIVYRAIRRLYPDAFLLCNLFPSISGMEYFTVGDGATDAEKAEFEGTTSAERLANWKKYITTFIDETGIDYLSYDQYPLSSNGVNSFYIRGLQIAAEVCKEKGIEFQMVSQSLCLGAENTRILSAKDAAWLNNMLLGLGVVRIGYFTYFDRESGAEYFRDYGGFVTHFGEKTPLYDIYQNIMAQNQKMAPTLLSFKYQTSAVYTGKSYQYMSSHVSNCVANTTYAKVSSVSVDKEAVLVSEMYDKDNNRYLYMIQNIVDPVNTGSPSYQTTTLTFNEKYTHALVLCEGKQTVVKLAEGETSQYTVTQHPGKAVYVIPFAV